MFSNERNIDAFYSYLKDLKDRKRPLWKKIKPKKCIGHDRQFALEICRKNCIPSLSYQASVNIGLLTYGVILCARYSSESLFAVNLNDDLRSGESIHELHYWSN